MSRTDSWAGLSPRARALVTDARTKERAEHEGAFGNVFPLYAYELPDGRVLHEVVQDNVWSGGPTFFTMLEDAATGRPVAEARWSDQELADYLGMAVGGALPAVTPEDASFFEQFRDGIEAGRIRLNWVSEQKYNRWKASLQG